MKILIILLLILLAEIGMVFYYRYYRPAQRKVLKILDREKRKLNES